MQKFLGYRIGWRTNRKLLVLESDDWGSIYLPSAHQIQRLEKANILPPNRMGYLLYDCLETKSDIEALLDLLSGFKNADGNSAKFTLNTVMGNPDFDKIFASNFQQYFHQHFFESYREYNNEDCSILWRSGIESGLIVPQFHAREHVNVPRWMNDLRSNRVDTRLAFENRFYCQTRSRYSPVDYLTAYWPDSLKALEEIEAITIDGLRMFEETFQFKSRTFVACCFVLPEELEACTASHGVQLIQTQKRHRVPRPSTEDSIFPTRFTGEINKFGQLYSVRNVLFEPAIDPSKDWAEAAFFQVDRAFKRNSPAIVCTHRMNFVGGRKIENRDGGLRQLRLLLQKVTNAFPDVEFLSSDQLLDEMAMCSK
jgi:hypothetical protein